MKAIVRTEYGPPSILTLEDLPKPEIKDDGVLIRLRSVSVNRSDWESLVGSPLYVRMDGLRHPKTRILGSDVAGTVEAVGQGVTRFRPGDEVVGELMYHGSKGFAEYVAVSERATLVTKPAGVTFAQAASIPQTGLIALQGIRAKGGLQPGESLLIVGGGGGSGTLAIQMAKRIGARVTGVDNTSKLPTMRDVGADEVVDYTVDDYTKLGVRYDRILDLVGARSLFANRRVLAERGVYLVVGGPVRRILGAAVLGKLVSVGRIGSMGVLMVRPNVVDLASLLEAVEARRIDPVIERTYRLDATPEALQKLGDNLARGKLVVGFE